MPGSRCDRCGGPTWWTVVRGVGYVACQAECIDVQGDLFGRNPPLIALELVPDEVLRAWELSGAEGVRPPEGGATNESDTIVEQAWGPPQDFLDTLWEGDCGETI